VLTNIAWELERYPTLIEVEGHTQKGGELASDGLTHQDPWELSVSRAYSAQKTLEKSGIKDAKFWRVAGYGDKVPMDEKDPANEENRRISIVIRPKEDGEIRDMVNELRLK
jgi:flagellar motor protein MotB